MKPLLHQNPHLLVVVLIFVLFLPTVDMRGNMDQDMDWTVKEGDSRTYIYKKYFSIYSEFPY